MLNSRDQKKCHDCNCSEGELHAIGCDMERCFKCGGQLISCDPFYNCDGMPKTTEKKRIPYIQYPNMCSYCGKLWPDFFNVPDKEWKKYIEPGKRDTVICIECYNHIKTNINAGAGS